MSRMGHPEDCGCIGCATVRAKEDAAKSERSEESRKNEERVAEARRSAQDSANRAAAEWSRRR
jgi:hypothetical protein